MKGYTKYTWVGNRIDDADMATLYHIKKETKKPISQMVADAVAEYVLAFCETEEAKKSGLVA